MSVKILAKQILPNISRSFIKKDLYPSTYAKKKAYFWLHRLKNLATRKCEGYFKAFVITEAITNLTITEIRNK